jgi:hypothetical protein
MSIGELQSAIAWKDARKVVSLTRATTVALFLDRVPLARAKLVAVNALASWADAMTIVRKVVLPKPITTVASFPVPA